MFECRQEWVAANYLQTSCCCRCFNRTIWILLFVQNIHVLYHFKLIFILIYLSKKYNDIFAPSTLISMIFFVFLKLVKYRHAFKPNVFIYDNIYIYYTVSNITVLNILDVQITINKLKNWLHWLWCMNIYTWKLFTYLHIGSRNTPISIVSLSTLK